VQVVWTPFAIHAARRIIAKHAITTVLVNLPPYSCLYIANAIKRRFPNVKLILDFRDEWIDNYLAVFDSAASNYKLRLAHKLEREAVSRADYVTAVTRSQLKQIHDRYPEQPQAKFVYAPNGYDPVLYSRFSRRKKAAGKMVVSYFGTVYANETYDPILNYLDVVDELPAVIRDAIETRFIGRVAREAASFLEGRKSAVRRLGFMPKHEAIGYLAESDYNLVVSGNPTTHAGKLFDYLAMGTPIIALCPVDGEMAQVLRETRAGWCVNPRDRAAIRDLLLAAYERTQNDAPSQEPDWEAIRFYEWPNLVARLAKIVGMGSTQRI
jgi:glycosyltransferase involved in cell wall biosynthesis